MVTQKSRIVLRTIDEAIKFIHQFKDNVDDEDVEVLAYRINDLYPNLGKVPPPNGAVRYRYRTFDGNTASAQYKQVADRGIYVERQKAGNGLYMLDAFPWDTSEKNFLKRLSWSAVK